jgi:hypothetical protein
LKISSLGEIKVEKRSFKHIEQKLEELSRLKWTSLNEFQKQSALSDLLFRCIKEDERQFLLREVADFIEKVHEKKLCEQFNIYVFESFLNHYLKVDDKLNLAIRAKITGKSIPRNDFQALFPIGMDKYYEGPHFVTAHASPDLDTMVSSFWGWVDAFSARVALGCHFWNVPGGPPKGSIEKTMLFSDIFGEKFFENFSKDKAALTITGFELFTKKGLKVVHPEALLTELESENDSLIVTQDDGAYLADFKGSDAENFRRITSAIFSVLRAFDSKFQHLIIQTFSKAKLHRYEVKEIVETTLKMPIEKNEAFLELSSKIQHQVHLFMQEVLKLESGVQNTFEAFFQLIVQLGKKHPHVRLDGLKALFDKALFNNEELVVDDRAKILEAIDSAVMVLKDLMELVRKVFASFHFAIKTKQIVFSHSDGSVSTLSDLEEIKTRMGAHPFITVNMHHDSSLRLPMGVIYAHDLQKPILGTVTVRDFTNKDETKVPPYLEVISGLDHHKMVMNSSTPMTLKIMDVQSANTLVAYEAFKINDRYSLGGLNPDEIDRLLETQDVKTASGMRIYQRLLQRKMNAKKAAFHIDSEREMMEYYHFLFAILDDTDLLSKVTVLDVECVAMLVNRLKSLQLKKEVEIVNFDDLDLLDEQFVKKAAMRLLQNEEVYSLYRTVYQKREKAVEEHLEAILKNPTFPLFEDTKVQNGLARVGQKKLYSSNIKAFMHVHQQVIALWSKESQSVFEKNNLIDLHMLMISTVASCEDVFKGAKVAYSHQDELWFYVPNIETARVHLKLFLSQFQRNKMILKHAESLKVTIYGKKSSEIKICFEESFLSCPIEEKAGLEGIVVLSHAAGILNSRKSMISPFLPNL